MCTALTYKTKDSYFGRNLDLEYSYNETVTITPRNYVFHFTKAAPSHSHYAIIGMAYVKDNYPLYYDATNEKGLSMAGLNFPNNASYNEESEDIINVSPFEFIPYVLSQCSNILEAKELLKNVNLVNIDFSDELKLSPLHWIIADKDEAITVESVEDGLKIYNNPFGVLTNNPTFDMQVFNLNNYMHLTTGDGKNTFVEGLEHYSRGMGAMGLPGDWSSQSRFVKMVFVKKNSVSDIDEDKSVVQFFHMLSSVEMPRGCVKFEGKNDITQYSSCCNANRGIYYYKTYDSSQINAVYLNRENLDGKELVSYPLIKRSSINIQN